MNVLNGRFKFNQTRVFVALRSEIFIEDVRQETVHRGRVMGILLNKTVRIAINSVRRVKGHMSRTLCSRGDLANWITEKGIWVHAELPEIEISESAFCVTTFMSGIVHFRSFKSDRMIVIRPLTTAEKLAEMPKSLLRADFFNCWMFQSLAASFHYQR